MKSSTIRRSTLSRETMEVIENLSKENDSVPSEYVRPEEEEKTQQIQLKIKLKKLICYGKHSNQLNLTQIPQWHISQWDLYLEL